MSIVTNTVINLTNGSDIVVILLLPLPMVTDTVMNLKYGSRYCDCPYLW